MLSEVNYPYLGRKKRTVKFENEIPFLAHNGLSTLQKCLNLFYSRIKINYDIYFRHRSGLTNAINNYI